MVRDLGTAVHRTPSIEVIENPAGRFAFVDMLKKGSDTSRWKERKLNRQGDGAIQRAPRPQVVVSSILSMMMFAKERSQQSG